MKTPGRIARGMRTQIGGSTITTTFNSSGVYIPKYGRAGYTVAGKGADGNSSSGGNTNDPTPGNTNPLGYQAIYTTFLQRKDGGIEQVPGGTGAPVYGSPAPAPYCNPFQPDNTSSVYNGSTSCVTYGNVGGNTNPSTPGNTNPITPGTAGQSITVFGVTFPGGAVATPATPVGDTAIPEVAYKETGYTITVPPSGYVTIKEIPK